MQYLGNLIKNNFSRILNAFFSNKRVFDKFYLFFTVPAISTEIARFQPNRFDEIIKTMES